MLKQTHEESQPSLGKFGDLSDQTSLDSPQIPPQMDYFETRFYLNHLGLPEVQTSPQIDKAYVEALLHQVQVEARILRNNRATFRGVIIFLVLTLAFVFRDFMTHYWQFDVVVGIIGVLFLFCWASMSRQDQDVVKLAQFDDIRAVGPLAETLDTVNNETRAVAVRALTRLLPKLKASDTDLLDSVQRECLNHELLHAADRGDTDLVLALLKAYEQIGDNSALQTVQKLQRLVSGETHGRDYSQIQEAVTQCLTYLSDRYEQEHNAETLLRASARETDPEELLRPASGVIETDINQLLRSVNPAPSQDADLRPHP